MISQMRNTDGSKHFRFEKKETEFKEKYSRISCRTRNIGVILNVYDSQYIILLCC